MQPWRNRNKNLLKNEYKYKFQHFLSTSYGWPLFFCTYWSLFWEFPSPFVLPYDLPLIPQDPVLGDSPTCGPSLPTKCPRGTLHRPLPLQRPLFWFGFLNIMSARTAAPYPAMNRKPHNRDSLAPNSTRPKAGDPCPHLPPSTSCLTSKKLSLAVKCLQGWDRVTCFSGSAIL